MTKALMFFSAGNAVHAYNSNNMNMMQGLIKIMPFTGASIFLGVFALVGMPPFSIFISKLWILVSAFRGGYYFVAALILIFIALAFAGLLFHISKIVLGNAPAGSVRQKERLSSKAAFVFLGLFIIGFGLKIPQGFMELLLSCQRLILGQ